jgi:hypothetical protein
MGRCTSRLGAQTAVSSFWSGRRVLVTGVSQIPRQPCPSQAPRTRKSGGLRVLDRRVRPPSNRRDQPGSCSLGALTTFHDLVSLMLKHDLLAAGDVPAEDLSVP